MTTPLDYMGNVAASTKQKAAEVLAHVPGADHITHVWGYDPNVSNTEHHSGFAADFMVFIDKALGDRIYDYLWKNRERLGVRWIIWQQSIISTEVQPGVRRAMADRGSTTANHLDHVHVLFSSKAYAAPTQPKPTQTKSATPMLRNGSEGAEVRALQKGLNRVFPSYSRLAVDGDFGPATERVVREFQKRTHLSVDGVVGPQTRARLAGFGVTF